MSKPASQTPTDPASQLTQELSAVFSQALDHHKQGRLDEAEAGYLKVLQHMPQHAHSWRNLGVLQRKRGNAEAAVALGKRSMALTNTPAEVVANIENALIDVSRADQAFSLALQLPPKLRPNLSAVALKREGRLRRGVGHAREACQLFDQMGDPESDVALDHAMALLEAGRYREGFVLYEKRWQSGQISPPKLSVPKWNYQDDLTGKHVLLFAEQGLGDWIFLSRFIPHLRAEGLAKLSIVVRPPLVRLMEACGLADAVYNRDAPGKMPDFDTWLSAFDLGRLYLDEDQPIAQPVAYAIPDDSLDRGRTITAPFDDRLKVGICWATSPTGKKSGHKSVDMLRFLPLTDVPGTQFFSLYKGKDDDAVVNHGLHPVIWDSGRSERDMADCAGLIAHLDLVITVDTAVAHLAATLGKPTWILVPEPAFWYWRPFGEASAFYPSARLIRQSLPGDWQAPFDRIRMDLERMLR